MDIFDKSQEYEGEIKKLVQQLAALCYEKHLPMFCCVAVANSAAGTEYRAESITSDKAGVHLSDDQISRHINVLQGFVTRLPDEPIVLDL